MKHVPALCLSLAIACTPALAKEDLPDIPIHRQMGVQYISAGNTPLEYKAMHKLSGRYWMQFSIGRADQDGVVLQGVQVVLRDIRGVALMEARAEGPLFFMTPPQGGRYTVEFTYDGETVSHTMDLVGRRYVQMEIRFKRDAASGGEGGQGATR